MEILEQEGVAYICGQELRGREEDQPSPSTGWTLYLSPPNNLCPEKQFELTLTTAAGPAQSVPTTTLPPSTIVIPPRRKSCLGITNGVRGTFCFHRSATGKELEFRQQEMYRWLQKPAASRIRIVSDSTIRCLQSNGAVPQLQGPVTNPAGQQNCFASLKITLSFAKTSIFTRKLVWSTRLSWNSREIRHYGTNQAITQKLLATDHLKNRALEKELNRNRSISC